MYLFCFLILLQALSVSLSYDLGIEAVLRLSDDFYKNFGNQQQSIFIRSKGKLPKKFSRSSIMRATWVSSNRTNELIKYVDHLKRLGKKSLEATAEDIMMEMNIKEDFVQQNIKNVTKSYEITLQNYLEYVVGQKKQCVIEEEFTFLDMVETATRLLYDGQIQLLTDAIEVFKINKTNNNTIHLYQGQIDNLNQSIYRKSINTKKEQMRHICREYKVCRPYPAFTDYCTDFIVQLLQIPNESLATFLKLFKTVMEMNSDFLDMISEEKDRTLITAKISSSLEDINGTKEALSDLTSILRDRFKIIDSPDLKLKVKMQAVRILLDIIDKAFKYEHDTLIFMEFDHTIQSLRSWINKEKFFPESVVSQLLQNIMTAIEFNLTKNAKQEVNVLVETILRGSSKNEKLFKTLFRDGSSYVKGVDSVPNVEVI